MLFGVGRGEHPPLDHQATALRGGFYLASRTMRTSTSSPIPATASSGESRFFSPGRGLLTKASSPQRRNGGVISQIPLDRIMCVTGGAAARLGRGSA